MWMTVYKILPVKITYTDDIPEGTGGLAKGFFIKIRPKYKDVDLGILNHELEHVKQFYRHGLIIHMFLYTFCKRYRFWAEVEAYKVQLNNYDNKELKKVLFIDYIVHDYNLDVIPQEVQAAFEK